MHEAVNILFIGTLMCIKLLIFIERNILLFLILFWYFYRQILAFRGFMFIWVIVMNRNIYHHEKLFCIPAKKERVKLQNLSNKFIIIKKFLGARMLYKELFIFKLLSVQSFRLHSCNTRLIDENEKMINKVNCSENVLTLAFIVTSWILMRCTGV